MSISFRFSKSFWFLATSKFFVSSLIFSFYLFSVYQVIRSYSGSFNRFFECLWSNSVKSSGSLSRHFPSLIDMLCLHREYPAFFFVFNKTAPGLQLLKALNVYLPARRLSEQRGHQLFGHYLGVVSGNLKADLNSAI